METAAAWAGFGNQFASITLKCNTQPTYITIDGKTVPDGEPVLPAWRKIGFTGNFILDYSGVAKHLRDGKVCALIMQSLEIGKSFLNYNLK